MFYVQIIWGKDLQSKAIDQWTRELPVTATRGKIVDRNGLTLVGNAQSYAVYARCRSVSDSKKTARVLAEVLDMDESSLYEKIRKHATSEITVKKRVDKESVLKLSEYELDGVYFTTDNTRVYPYGETACQILGYTSIDGKGQSGIESKYDEYLRGFNGEILYESDLVGYDLDGKSAKYVRATDGLNLKLTLDYEIQRICEAATDEVMSEYSPKSASVIVIDPKSGQILAASQKPSFDLNSVPRDDLDRLNALSRSTLISDSYEPGSTFKVLTAAMNIEEYLNGNPKAFSLDYVFNSSRYRMVDGKKVKCWSSHAGGKHANENLASALNNSCNPCFVDIVSSLGKEKTYEYLTRFGYGVATGVDFNGEAIGMLVPKSAATNGDVARISFGQSIAVTPLQLACATAAAINGGVYYEPYFVSEIYDERGIIAEKIEPKAKNRVISEDASRIISGYLEGVVKDGGGKRAYIEGYRVGGKTGVFGFTCVIIAMQKRHKKA